MEEQNLFQPVMDDNEQIVKLLYPLKLRAWISTIIWIVACSVIMLPIGICMIVFHEPINTQYEDTFGLGIAMLLFWVAISVALVIHITLWCRNTVYALTNKRVLIRTGFIGVTHKSLDFNKIGALVISVNAIDKIMRKNTGSIVFGITDSSTSENDFKFNFMFVQDPYQVYKEIESHIDSKKDSKTKKD